MTVEALRNERNGRTVPITQFYGDYKKNDTKICYAFVEGKDDPSYYRGIISYKLKENCSVILYPSGGKEVVANTYKQLDWRTYSKNRVVFFMDKDLSDIVSDPNIINENNVYITDKYSIENDIVCGETLNAVMRDLLGFSATPKEEIDKTIMLFENQKAHFVELLTPLMANIILWKNHRISPANYRNVKIDQIVRVHNGEVSLIHEQRQTIELFYKQSNVDFIIYDELKTNSMVEEIQRKGLPDAIIRGKYIAVFFIAFCNSIYRDCGCVGVTKTHSGRTLNPKDIMETIAPRSRAPKSLHDFLSNTIEKYYTTITS